MITPSEFKRWIDTAIRDAERRGMTDDEILLMILETVRELVSRKMLEVAHR